VAITSVAPQSLERRLGPFDAAAIIVSNVIGTGILFAPAQIAGLVPNAPLFFSTWIAGGLPAVSMCFSERRSATWQRS